MTNNAAIRKRLSVNFFANICELDPEYDTIFPTATSLFETFSLRGVAIGVFVHPAPFPKAFDGYEANVAKFLKTFGTVTITRTNGLADGYRRSIQQAQTPFLFQVEHDWLFYGALIRHNMDDILNAMAAGAADYLRFGKEPNAINKYGHVFVDARLGDLPVCAVQWRSNNPHIIDSAAYRNRYLGAIRVGIGGSSGIEECLPVASGAYVYGPIDYPATIYHTNGRTRLTLFRKSIGKILYNVIAKAGLLEPAFRFWLRRSRSRPTRELRSQ